MTWEREISLTGRVIFLVGDVSGRGELASKLRHKWLVVIPAKAGI